MQPISRLIAVARRLPGFVLRRRLEGPRFRQPHSVSAGSWIRWILGALLVCLLGGPPGGRLQAQGPSRAHTTEIDSGGAWLRIHQIPSQELQDATVRVRFDLHCNEQPPPADLMGLELKLPPKHTSAGAGMKSATDDPCRHRWSGLYDLLRFMGPDDRISLHAQFKTEPARSWTRAIPFFSRAEDVFYPQYNAAPHPSVRSIGPIGEMAALATERGITFMRKVSGEWRVHQTLGERDGVLIDRFPSLAMDRDRLWLYTIRRLCVIEPESSPENRARVVCHPISGLNADEPQQDNEQTGRQASTPPMFQPQLAELMTIDPGCEGRMWLLDELRQLRSYVYLPNQRRFEEKGLKSEIRSDVPLTGRLLKWIRVGNQDELWLIDDTHTTVLERTRSDGERVCSGGLVPQLDVTRRAPPLRYQAALAGATRGGEPDVIGATSARLMTQLGGALWVYDGEALHCIDVATHDRCRTRSGRSTIPLEAHRLSVLRSDRYSLLAGGDRGLVRIPVDPSASANAAWTNGAALSLSSVTVLSLEPEHGTSGRPAPSGGRPDRPGNSAPIEVPRASRAVVDLYPFSHDGEAEILVASLDRGAFRCTAESMTCEPFASRYPGFENTVPTAAIIRGADEILFGDKQGRVHSVGRGQSPALMEYKGVVIDTRAALSGADGSTQPITALAAYGPSGLLVGFERGLALVHGSGVVTERVSLGGSMSSGPRRVSDSESRSGVHVERLAMYDANGTLLRLQAHPRINRLMIDRTGTLWAATSGGLFRGYEHSSDVVVEPPQHGNGVAADPQPVSLHRHLLELRLESSSPGEDLRDVVIDSLDRVWMPRGNGLGCYQFLDLTRPCEGEGMAQICPDMSGNQRCVTALYWSGEHGELWAGTEDGRIFRASGLHRLDARVQLEPVIAGVSHETNSDGEVPASGATALGGRVEVMGEDRNGNLWMLTSDYTGGNVHRVGRRAFVRSRSGLVFGPFTAANGLTNEGSRYDSHFILKDPWQGNLLIDGAWTSFAPARRCEEKRSEQLAGGLWIGLVLLTFSWGGYLWSQRSQLGNWLVVFGSLFTVSAAIGIGEATLKSLSIFLTGALPGWVTSLPVYISIAVLSGLLAVWGGGLTRSGKSDVSPRLIRSRPGFACLAGASVAATLGLLVFPAFYGPQNSQLLQCVTDVVDSPSGRGLSVGLTAIVSVAATLVFGAWARLMKRWESVLGDFWSDKPDGKQH